MELTKSDGIASLNKSNPKPSVQLARSDIFPLQSISPERELLKPLSSQNKTLAHLWQSPKKSSVLSSSIRLCTIHNRSNVNLYVTVYDKVRMGMSGRHTRVSPVYEVEGIEFIFEKPFLRGSKSIWLLFCKDISLFDVNDVEMADVKFRAFQKIPIDFSTDIVINTGASGSLTASTKLDWEKEQKRQHLSPTPSHKASIIPHGLSTTYNVRNSNTLCQKEIEFLEKRDKITTAALESFLDISLEGKNVPRIAFCGSGGGCRSMVSTIGSLIGLEEIKFLDCLTYVAGVSGSTWSLAVWESLAITPTELRENIIEKFNRNVMGRVNSASASELRSLLKHNDKSTLDVSLVDIFGAQLSAGLLYDTTPKGAAYHLSDQLTTIDSGDFPMPIYTAIQRHVDEHHSWFEFSPFEVGCTEYKCFVPSCGFGRKYYEGKSIDYKTEPSFGLLLGTFGSAFCAPIERMSSELFEKYEKTGDESDSNVKSSRMAKTVMGYRESVENLIDKMKWHQMSLVAGSKFSNFTYDTSMEGSRQNEAELDLYDAGIDSNLPFPVLLRQERKIDIIIATDASKFANISKGRALVGGREWAERNGVKFPPFVPDTAFEHLVSVFHDEEDPYCPVIIYLPLKTNPEYSSFDPQQNQLESGYCSTFNFKMTEDQVFELSSLTQFNMLSARSIIRETVLKVINLQNQM